MSRLRTHRLTVVVFVALAVATIGAASAASRVVEENEVRLLRDRTAQIQSLLESLGGSLESELAAIAAIGHVTEADVTSFRAAAVGVDQEVEGATDRGYRLLTVDGSKLVDVAAVGTSTPVAELPAAWTAEMVDVADGRFTILGFLGEGLSRRFAMAQGHPGGDVVVYSEYSLLGATSDSASDTGSTDILQGVSIEVFVGTEPNPEELVFAIGKANEAKEERVVVDLSGVEILLEVSPLKPLAGAVAFRLPLFLMIGGIVLAVAIAAVVEIGQRRRNDALSAVADLREQNRRLDQALAEQRTSEAARADLEGQLRQTQRMDAIGQLAAGVAHDFNNVLTAILSYAELAADTATDEQSREDLQSIQSAARKGASLTRQLLQFSRREAGKTVAVDLNERAADVVSMLSRTVGERVALRMRLTEHPRPVVADPVEIDQVILNLIVNARDAIEGSGTITVSTLPVEIDAEDAARRLVPAGTYLRLAVTDDGTGMPLDVQEHIFDPFFTTKGRGEGTGLGLSTVYGIVQRHGGHVSVVSSPGAGTTIEVLLPVSSDKTTQIAMTTGARA